MPTRSSIRGHQGRLNESTTENKENAKLNGAKVKAKTKARGSSKAYCSCRKGDDGSPMILCAECNEWYHFRCIPLSEKEAEEIESYICPSCHERTGLRTVRDWEGPEAFEEVVESKSSIPTRRTSLKPSIGSQSEQETAEAPEPPTETSDDSGDEYVVEKHKTTGKRQARRVSVLSSESEAESSAQGLKRLRRGSGSVTVKDVTRTRTRKTISPANTSKRKPSISSQPPAKRQRSESTAGGDATRKYCLEKLQELFVGIFMRYPYLRERSSNGETADEDGEPDKQPEELTDEDKQILEDKAKRFAIEVESCMHDIYSEPDKTGKHVAVGKYKERFRMLTFNLGQSDRIVLHKGIASSRITPKELSTMSSTELASEETKKTIKELEQEALEHSIIQRTTLPRAKITHKGLQDIEDVNGTVRVEDEREREREEEEQRIARERLARIKPEPLRDPSTGVNSSGSVPPESPVVPHTPTWGAPPPVPMRALHPDEHVTLGRSLANPVFGHNAPDYNMSTDGELNLADLINIDDDPLPDAASGPSDSASGNAAVDSKTDAESKSIPDPTVARSPVTAISPFAPKSELSDMQPQASFDLSSFWSSREADPDPHEAHVSAPEAEPHVASSENEHRHEAHDEHMLGEEADDQDFDMFLGRDEDEKEEASPVDTSPEGQRASFEALPRVWLGTISMPLDSLMAQEVSLEARQIGGRPLDHEPLLWQTLFPAHQLRIDGRVPVDKSAHYLTQMRLNTAKELIAVAFSPSVDSENSGFTALVDYLIAKQRHGLIFPWGNRPKDYHPGRELYIIPLLASDPIPEYMELLDNLRLPKNRKTSLLVGVWVLNSGKLAPPPGASGAAPPAPSFDRPSIPAPLPLQQPAFGQAPAPPPSSVPSTSSLAAEVASLTPEQIQLMLRTLASSGVSPPQPSQAPPPIPLPIASAVPGASAWAPPNPAYSLYPPASAYGTAPGVPVPVGIPPLPPQPQASYSAGPPPPQARPYPEHYEQPFDRGNGERGYRGRGNGRGRGRGRDRDRGGRPRDTGWPKERGRGRGGFSSPQRERGGRWDEQPRWN